MYVYIGFKTFFYVVRHLDSIASYLPTGLHVGFFRSWPSLFLPSSFSSVFLVLTFVSASTSMLFWTVFLLPFFEYGHNMWAGSVSIYAQSCYEWTLILEIQTIHNAGTVLVNNVRGTKCINRCCKYSRLQKLVESIPLRVKGPWTRNGSQTARRQLLTY